MTNRLWRSGAVSQDSLDDPTPAFRTLPLKFLEVRLQFPGWTVSTRRAFPRTLPEQPGIQWAMTDALRNHWPEYLIEAGSLAFFMISAFLFATMLEYPSSPVHQAIPSALLRRFLMGLAMGGTAVAIIYSRWGKQSGAHINPATTLTFFRLGKINSCDAAAYVASQFAGGLLGAILASALLSSWAAHPSVNYVVTAPGSAGAFAAFCAEIAIAFVLMTVILRVSNHQRLHRLTGLCAGVLVTVYITFEAPISGMSMNPARTFASAVPARYWTDLWIYFTAPLAGMLAAAELHLRIGKTQVRCAKLHHENDRRCIFCGKPETARKFVA